MVLGIFDVFHINEFNGKITNWVEVLVTMIGTGLISGFIAYFAAKWQIKRQRKLQENLQNIEDEKDRVYLKYLINQTLKEFCEIYKTIYRSKVNVNILQKTNTPSYVQIQPKIPTRLKELDSSKTFHILLPGTQSQVDIKLYTEFIKALENGIQLVKLFNRDLVKHDKNSRKIRKRINNLFQNFITTLDFDEVDSNPNSLFKTSSKIGEKMNEVIMKNKKHSDHNPLFYIKELSDYMHKYIIQNNKTDRSNLKLIHFFVIPIHQDFIRLTKTNESINTKIETRLTELKNVMKGIESFRDVL